MYTLTLGGTGFIGSNLVYEYIRMGEKVIVFSETNGGKRLIDVSDKIVSITGKIGELDLLESLFKQYEIKRVIHLISSLIPSSSFEEFILEHEKVIFPTLRLMQIMSKYNVKKFVYLSSGGTVYGNYKENGYYNETDLLKPVNYYGLSKRYMEELIKFESRNNNIKYLILRPSNPFGKYQDMNGKVGLISVILGKVVSGEELQVWGDGKIVRDYIPIKYLCTSLIKLCSSNIHNEVFNIGSGKGHSINDIIRIIKNITNKELKVNYAPSRKVDAERIILNIDKLKTYIAVDDFELEKSICDYYNSIMENKND